VPVRISDIRATTVAIPLEASLRYCNGVHPGRFVRTVVEVFTDEGITGLGEVGGSGASSDALIAALRERLVGQDPFRTERLRRIAYHPTESAFYEDLSQGFAAVEFACLDIQGKALGRPVHELLGGALREQVDFAGYLFFRYPADDAGPVASAEQMVAHARELVDRHGFQTLKLKGGVFSPEHEVEVTRALRAAFPEHRLRFDPNSNWSVEEAIRHAPAFEAIGLEYYEDPCWGFSGMARLRGRTRLPLATNTIVTKVDHIPQAVAMQAVDVVLIDPHFFGGIRSCLTAAAVCGAFGIGVGMHSSGECGISLAAMLHVAAATPELAFAADAHYHHMTDDVLVGGKLAYKDGAIAVPTGPGLGVELDPDRMARYHELYQQLGAYVFTGDTHRPDWVPMIPERDWAEP
jgi:glucarate dehydratase